MQRKTIYLTIPALLLCIAAWLAGRYSSAAQHSLAPPHETTARVRKAGEHLNRRQPETQQNLSIPGEALQNVERFEAWLAASLGEPKFRPGELSMHNLVFRCVRMAERLGELDDDSVRRLAEFLGRREAREHFESSQIFFGVIPRVLAELARRDRTALPAWVMQAAADGGDWKSLLHYTGELTLRERLDLARQLSKSYPQTGETQEPLEAALKYLRLGEIEEATRMAESLPEERRGAAFGEIVRGMAFTPNSTSDEWQNDYGPLLTRVFPEKVADDLHTRQTLYAMFSRRLGREESGADCAAWLEAQSLSPWLRAVATKELLSAWMSTDPGGAVAWRFQHPQTEDRASVLEQIVSTWVDPTSMIRRPREARIADASEWLEANAPGAEADRARAVLAKSWSILKEPEAGAAWAAAITDPALRENTQQDFADPFKAALGGQSWQEIAAGEIRSRQ